VKRNSLEELQSLTARELRARYTELTGEPAQTPNPRFYIRRIREWVTAPRRAHRPQQPAEQPQATDAGAHEQAEVGHEEVGVSSLPADADAEGDDQSSAPHHEMAAELPAPPEVRAEEPPSTNNEQTAVDQEQPREAEKEQAPTGRRRIVRAPGVEMVLAMRFLPELVDRIDEIWRRHGMRSRMDFFRAALHHHLRALGENEVAAMLPTGGAMTPQVSTAATEGG